MSYKTEIKNNQPPILLRRNLLTVLPLSALLFSMGISTAHSAKPLTLKEGVNSLPEDEILADHTDHFSLSTLENIPLLVNFWATWCGPCVVELPHLEQAANLLKDSPITVVLVNIDKKGPDIARPFLAERGVTLPLSAYDSNGLWPRQLNLRGLPATLLIKADRSAYSVHLGPAEWHKKEVLDQVKAYLS